MAIENDQTMIFHVTAGNVKFVLCSESMTMTNFSSSIQFFSMKHDYSALT